MSDKNIFALIVGLLFNFCTASGCTCVSSSTYDLGKEIKETPVIISGKIIGSSIFEVKTGDSVPGWSAITFVNYRVAIQQVFKGKFKHDTIDLVTGMGNGDCGYEFSVGVRYIIFANYEVPYNTYGKKIKPFLCTDRCRHNGIETDENLRELNRYFKSKALRKSSDNN